MTSPREPADGEMPRGHYIDVSMLRATVAAMGAGLMEYELAGQTPRLQGSYDPAMAPLRQLYQIGIARADRCYGPTAAGRRALLLGEHNLEVFGSLLGVDAGELARLERVQVIW